MNEEISLFSFSTPKFRIDKPVRLIELFAGIGAQAKALERLGIPFEHWYVCEIDRFAIASYNAVHGTNFETKDITKLHADELKIREREVLLHNDLLISLSGLVACGKAERNVERERYKKRSALGSRASA